MSDLFMYSFYTFIACVLCLILLSMPTKKKWGKMDACVITPCSRPENLPLLRVSIPLWMNWIIVFDTDNYKLHDWFGASYLYKRGGVAGKNQINTALQHLKRNGYSGYIYILDDDNIMHENINDIFIKYTSNPIIQDLIYFDQELNDGSIRKPSLNVGEIDQGQYIFKINNQYFENKYEADGLFAVNYNGDKIYIPQTLSYYNRIRKWN